MIDYMFLWGAVAIMAIIIIREILRKTLNVDMDKIDVTKAVSDGFSGFDKSLRGEKSARNHQIIKNTGECSLTLLDAGVNKITVLTTLRQITEIGLKEAKSIIDNTPSTFMINLSEEEANLTKEALEFVGAKVEIK